MKNSRMSVPARSGFTLVELLVVMTIIAVLAAMLMATLGKAKLKAQGIHCLNNHRQLTVAWRMYAEDSHDALVYASDDPGDPTLPPPGYAVLDQYAWTLSHMNLTSARWNWDINYDMILRPLWPYAKNAGIYKCPADHSTVNVGGAIKPRIRTMAMNCYVGGFDGTDGHWPFAAPYWIYSKISHLSGSAGPPDKIFVFLDERDDRINWGNFMADMTGYDPMQPALWGFTEDLPGYYHNRACGFSFADGHSELHKWRDPRTIPAYDPYNQSPTNSARNQDVYWLQDHSTRRK